MREPGRPWRGPLALLVAIRIAIPLVSLAGGGRCRSETGFCGDGSAYYSTARALVSGWRSLGAAAVAVVAVGLVAAAVVAVRLWRARPAWRAPILAGGALALAGAAAAGIAETGTVPAGAVGWPLLWAVPLLPLRALHAAGPDGAYAAGLGLSLAANAVTVVATAYAGLHASGRRAVGLGAAALFALWPGLSWLLAGSRGWENGTWQVDAGLHMYTEPLSTACVAAGIALALAPRPTRLQLAGSGLAFGCAFAVRPTNGLAALVVLALLLARDGLRAALPWAAGALAVAPVVLAFLPHRTGYDVRPVSDASGALFGVRYVGRSWADSLLWGPRALAILVPVALAGALVLRRPWAALLLAGSVLGNAAFYSFARATAEHPRYLFASLPPLLVLFAAGAAAALSAFRKDRGRAAAPPI